MKTGRTYMSIGEVLATLKSEFPDVSVSKIRFLESEGLIAPERTASGYRKFAQTDLDRLRFILKLQRDSFLPLKVIRERLAAADAGSVALEQGPAAPITAGARVSQDQVAAPADASADDDLTGASAAAHLTESDLAVAAGLELKAVQSLRDYGVICQHSINGGGAYFDDDDLQVVKIAKDFLALGIEPRHLKTLRRFAEQEAALFEQVVTPAMRTRRPDARENAIDTLTKLAKLSRALRHAYVRQSLRATLNGDR